jgi:aspartate racemase
MTKNTVNIGILGLGNRSTLFYIDQLNTFYNSKLKNYSTCKFILYNTNFQEINPFLPVDFQKLEPVLTNYISEIKSLNINYLIIPNITLHQTFDRLTLNIKIAHPIQITIQRLQKNNFQKAVVFASKYMMASDYLKASFLSKGISIIEPSEEDKTFIEYMRHQLYEGKETDSDILNFEALKLKYTENQPLIIACTELSIFSCFSDSKVYDMALLQVEEAVNHLIN